MNDPKRIPADRDDEWRDAETNLEPRLRLRLRPDLRQAEPDDDSDGGSEGEDGTY